MAQTTFNLTILSPEKNFFTGEAEEVIFFTPKGSIGIMAGHSPMIASVSEGIMEILLSGTWKIAAVGQGFCDISPDRAEFYLDTAEWADEIDEIRAKEALERAETRMKSNVNEKENLYAKAAISRALARLHAAQVASEREK